MNAWQTVELGTVCAMDRRTIPASRALGDGLRFVGMENVDAPSGKIIHGEGSRTGDGRGQVFLFDERHVLFGKLRPYLRKIARPVQTGCSSTELVPLLPNPEHLSRDFLFHWVRQQEIINILMEKHTGARMPRADMSVLLGLGIPLPPLWEQRRIAGLLDQAAAIRRRADAAREHARAILPALFLHMFGDPATNPKGWEQTRFEDVVSDFRYGTNQRCHEELLPDDIPVLRIPNVLGGRINWDDLKFAALPDREIAKTKLHAGDLLFVRTNGNPDYIGRCAAFDGAQPASYASYLIRARLRSKLVSEFAVAYFNHDLYRPVMRRAGRTTAGNYNLSVAGLAALPVIIPPLPLQTAFAEQAQKIEAMASALDLAAARADAMAQSLSARLFRA